MIPDLYGFSEPTGGKIASSSILIEIASFRRGFKSHLRST